MATLSSEVEEVWRNTLFTRSEILEVTDRIFYHDVSVDSGFRTADLYYDNGSDMPSINFLICTFLRQRDEFQVGGGSRYTFRVQLEYYLQQTDISGETQRAHRDRLEMVDDLVRTALGSTWQSTVDYWQGGVPIQPSTVKIEDRDCWRGGYTYTAFKAL